jgi:predicted nucleic acid-binding protein
VAATNPDLDRGERAALALASDVAADLVLIDDAAGRREAKALGLRIMGSLGILRLAAEQGLVDVPQIVSRLRQEGFYIEESLVTLAFGEWLS